MKSILMIIALFFMGCSIEVPPMPPIEELDLGEMPENIEEFVLDYHRERAPSLLL